MKDRLGSEADSDANIQMFPNEKGGFTKEAFRRAADPWRPLAQNMFDLTPKANKQFSSVDR